jgi:predicted nucleotidyltransferase
MNSILEDIVQTIKENTDPEKIILFGSKVDHPENNSDYDICVLKANIPHKRRLAHELYKLLYRLRIALDIVVDTPEHFEEMRDETSFIYHEIMKTGKVIYEKK